MNSILIVGGGLSGVAAARLAVLLNYNVTLADRNPDNISELLGVDIVDELDVDTTSWQFVQVVVSPGVPRTNRLITAAIEQGLPILSELNFASRHVNTPLLAVTGTNGKSSTVWYAKQLATQLGYATFLGGNFGIPLSELVIEQMTKNSSYDVAIVEVSSYQLEWSLDFHPLGAGILNLTPDHLARHKTMEEYRRCKMKLFQNQTAKDTAVVPLHDNSLVPESTVQIHYFGELPQNETIGCFYDDTALYWIHPTDSWSLPIVDIPLLGRHNLENVAVAALLVKSIDQTVNVQPVHLTKLVALEHRLESIVVKNRLWINDSKATNLEATFAALESLNTPATILLGGAGKDGANYSRLIPLLQDKASAVITFGASGKEIREALEPLTELVSIKTVVDLSSAIELARLEFAPHPVLLSPACASFDEFANFAERGRYFKKTIMESS